MQAKIENSLLKTLLLEGEMHYALYEFELVEHIDYWKESLRKDKDDFIFIVTSVAS